MEARLSNYINTVPNFMQRHGITWHTSANIYTASMVSWGGLPGSLPLVITLTWCASKPPKLDNIVTLV